MSKLTDNKYISKKISIRMDALSKIESDDISVLDCFHGNGTLWSLIKKRDNRIKKVVGLDIKKESNHDLIVDNIKYLKSASLDRFDLIDLDAYASPFEQMKILSSRKYRGFVCFTWCQRSAGKIIPLNICTEIGIDRDFIIRNSNCLRKTSPVNMLCKILHSFFGDVQLSHIYNRTPGGFNIYGHFEVGK